MAAGTVAVTVSAGAGGLTVAVLAQAMVADVWAVPVRVDVVALARETYL